MAVAIKNKLLVFCPYYPPHVGGLESHAQEFNHYMDCSVTVFTPRLPLSAKEEECEFGKVRIVRFPAVEIIPNYPLPCFWKLQFWKLWGGIRKEKYDWVISRTRFFLTTVMAGVYAKLSRTKWLHIEHGSDFVKLDSMFTSAIAKIYDYTLGSASLKVADKAVANSKASAKFCSKLYNGRNYEVIYRGIDKEGLDSVVMKAKGAIKIIFVGRLIDGKGVGELIEALKMIDHKIWAAEIVGDGPARKKWEKEAKGLRIKFLGQKGKVEARKIMAGGDIVVNPSFTEGLPTSMIEGALLKKALVATDVGGTREVIEDKKSGRLYRPHDIESLKNILEELIDNRELRENYGQAAYRDNKNKFDWKESVKKYWKVLR